MISTVSSYRDRFLADSEPLLLRAYRDTSLPYGVELPEAAYADPWILSGRPFPRRER